MRSRDFTLERYQELCQAMIDKGYDLLTIKGFLMSEDARVSKCAILRHDVDRNPGNAVAMASLESQMGIQSTYYFRTTKQVYVPEIISKVASLGHEVGYHYENLSRSRGNVQRAIRSFQYELKAFRQMVDIKTICMHGNPLSRWDNRTLWNHYDFKRFGLIGEAYLSIDYSDVIYFTDTGRSWNAGMLNLLDHVPSRRKYEVRDTEGLIKIIENEEIERICIQTHPERWNQTYIKWGLSLSQDLFFNVIKIVLSLRHMLGNIRTISN